MNKEDMDKYLESIGGLVNGYFPERDPITDAYFFECGPGWYPLLKDLIDRLLESGWDKRVTQVKEKFGTLNFYTNRLTDKQDAIVDHYEQLSAVICEQCGSNSAKLRRAGWWKTLCDSCKEERVEKLKLQYGGG